jgi:hypothetical protein
MGFADDNRMFSLSKHVIIILKLNSKSRHSLAIVQKYDILVVFYRLLLVNVGNNIFSN